MPLRDEIEQALVTAFAPREVAVVDDSESHRGHAGWREGGETHFNVRLRAAQFAEMGRLARHRAVHNALGPAIVNRIHALALDLDA